MANASWRHVPTASNPADLISRGATVNELNDSCWFTGPDFLYDNHHSWPDKRIHRTSELPERKKIKTVLSCTVEHSFLELMYKYNFSKTRRVFAFVVRFINSLKAKIGNTKLNVRTGPLLPEELETATTKIVWAIQQKEFIEDINSLREVDKVADKSSLNSVNPFIDDSGLLRVGGRLRNTDIPYKTKYPILLPKNNAFVKAYVEHLHLRNFHAGPQALMGLIRRQFWIVNARNYTRNVVRKCIHCFKYKPKLFNQIMGDLPETRMKGSQAFENVGVDFCGPFYTTYKIRGKRPYKSYVAVFVCFLTRGVHLELVTDLSSEALIAALKRFTSRRRLCKHLYCDNATNFVGARRLLNELKEKFFSHQIQQEITHWCAEESITFHHIPPRSPHVGGIWEAAVRSAKSHLFRTLQNSLLTFEELTTVCCQIEAILNSGPLCQLSSDPNDEEALTPAHFCNQAPLNAILEPDFTSQNGLLVNRFRQISLLQQHFWKRWASEYLLSLHQRYKWKFSSPNVLVNSLVLISDNNLPSQKWLLGRVISVVQGRDGKVRVADVRTKAGVIRRAVHKLAPLPSPNED